MIDEPFDLLRRSLRGDPCEDRLRAALDHLQQSPPFDAIDHQAASMRTLAQLLSISPDSDQQTPADHRQIAGCMGSFGERVADVVAPGRPRAFADVPVGSRSTAVALHMRLRDERQFDVIVPILAGAGIRHRDRDDQGWLVLATVLESLLRLPADFGDTDRRRLTWLGQQLFHFWLEPSEVAMLVHARWLTRAPVQELQRWRELVPDRQPLLPDDLLAELVGAAARN